MIKFFAAHPTAANLLMVVLAALGLLALPNIRRETFPDFATDQVEVRIVYPGATAEEVEEAVCQRVEDALDGIRFVDELRAEAREGVGIITLDMVASGDFATFKGDIESEVEAIDDFPGDVEDAIITEIGTTRPVLTLLVSGPMATRDLKIYCEDLKDRLQRLDEVSLVDVAGFSEHQLRIELDTQALQRFGLSAAQVASIVESQSVDLPAGSIEARERDILLRFIEQRRTPRELESLLVRAGPEGAEVRLGDIARISDRFDKDEDKVVLNGRRAGMLLVERTKNQDTIEIAEVVKAFLVGERERYPSVELVVSQDGSTLVLDRLAMLITNGWQGLLLVFLTMWLFFSFKFSFWVAMGLPVSFLGAFYLMPVFGLTINMLTMVGLLLGLGLLMDDAIVIAENIATHLNRGKPALQAAIDGTREVLVGVLSSFVTTVFIFGALVFIEGDIGKVLRVMPMILILVLAVSLIEAFLILPAHLGHALHDFDPNQGGRFRRRFDAAIEWLRERVGRAAEWCLAWRYLTVGIIIFLFLAAVGLLAGGVLKYQAFPDLDGDVAAARVLLPQGTPLERTEEVVAQLALALERVDARFADRQPDGQRLVQTAYAQFNQNQLAFETGPHVATMTADLLSANVRNGRSDDILQAWREETGPVADVISLDFVEPDYGPAGQAIEVRLGGVDLDQLKQAATEMHGWFSQFAGVDNLADDLRPGKPELRVRLKDGAFRLGIDAATVARQLRAAYHGVTADEIQVGSASYEIDVRLRHQDQNSLADLDHFHLTLADGKQVPLDAVVEIETGRGWARIARVDGRRTVTLRGDVDPRINNTSDLMAEFQRSYLPGLTERHAEIRIDIEGEIKEGATTGASMGRALLIGLLGVFITLSFQFRSYFEPIIVMAAIPFALIGVVFGHVLLGVQLCMPSMIGFISLAGVVVNDSLLLVMFIKKQRGAGVEVAMAAAQASRSRFRAVLLTSLTTMAGLLPLLAERSLQAQIVIPAAISIVFGMLVSTVLVLIVIPCLYTMLADLRLAKLH